MAKKVYRSLFDSDDVYEVEEINDDPSKSTSGIAEVRKDEDGTEPTLKDCWNAIQKLGDAVAELAGKGKEKKDANEPAEENKAKEGGSDIDKSKPVNAQDADDGDGDEEKDNGEEDGKEVKDSYKAFTSVGSKSDKEAQVTAVQVAFQSRYDNIGNK